MCKMRKSTNPKDQLILFLNFK
ncbi:hypothetical protein Mgra_00000669 [Meloidogyne graminicola]|uniref:Uncharacterized protein n=1 Tax=Meloidogyne graminicola TaxID=189291 RepID=A0A8T0A2Z3_9BILA|nr:hypothetical protein Mgra_00000669 [Meloidogyne graminicola]